MDFSALTKFAKTNGLIIVVVLLVLAFLWNQSRQQSQQEGGRKWRWIIGDALSKIGRGY